MDSIEQPENIEATRLDPDDPAWSDVPIWVTSGCQIQRKQQTHLRYVITGLRVGKRVQIEFVPATDTSSVERKFLEQFVCEYEPCNPPDWPPSWHQRILEDD